MRRNIATVPGDTEEYHKLLEEGKKVSEIKTMDLCERCEYFFDNKCKMRACADCEMLNNRKECNCLTIRFNTPCPYFKEAENG